MKKDTFFLSALSIKRDTITIPASICLSAARYETLKKSLNLLNKKEILYLKSLTYQNCQFSYLSGRICVKKALGLLDKKFKPKMVYIEHGVFNQPILSVPIPHNIQVSISHSLPLTGAIAFPETHPMAIDIEQIDPTKVAFLENQLMSSEIARFVALSFPLEISVFYLWSAKEALSKVLRCGLTIDFNLLEVTEIHADENLHVLYFKNFFQYKVYILNLGNYVLSIILPKNSTLNLSNDIHHFDE